MSLKRKTKLLVCALLAAVMASSPFTAPAPLAETDGGSPAAKIAGAAAKVLAPLGAYAGPGTIDAGEEDCAYICSELGLLRGEGDGVTDAYLAKDTERIQAAYLTLRLVGKETEAERYTGSDNFNDVDAIYEGGQRRTAYLKAHSRQYGWEGDGTNRLMPRDHVTAQQFYKVLLTVLGYQANVDYPYEDTLDFAEDEAGMGELANMSGALTNDDIAVMLVEALLAYMRDETYTLAEYLAEEGVIDYDTALELGVISQSSVIAEPSPTPTPTVSPTPIPTTFADTSVGATNFAEIDIVFNQQINKDSVDRNYFKIDGAPLAATDYLRVLDDGVTLRIYRETGFVTQQGQRRTVSVSRVRSLSGAEMVPINAREIAFYDNQTPSLLEVRSIGLRRVALVFSEPLRTVDNGVKNYSTYKFNGLVMPASDAAVCNGRELYLNFSTPLTVGQNRLTIDRNRVYDLAGFPIFDVTDYAFNADEDRTPPQVISVDAWREKVTVTFSEEVRDSVRLSWLDGSSQRVATASKKDIYDRTKIEFTFGDGQYLPINYIDIVVAGIVDMNGNTTADYRTSVQPKFDTERPTVVSVESSAINEIVVGFSKPVKLGVANDNRFLLKNTNNITITLNVQAYTPTGASTPDTRYIKLVGSIPAGTYTLTVYNVEDTTAQANRSVESTHSIVVQDKNPPQIQSVSANIAESKVVIVFNKQLDWNTSTDTANYEYFYPGRGHVTVPAGTTAFLEGDGRTIVLTFPAGGWVVGGNQNIPNAFSLYIATNAADELRVQRVTDTLGNAIQPTLADIPGTNEIAAKLQASLYAVSTQRLMMRFEATGALPVNAASQDFIVRAGSQNLPFRGMGYNSVNTSLRELYIDFDSFELNTDGTYGAAHTPVTVAMVVPNQVSLTKTALGTPLEILNGATVQVTDNIKPGLLEAYRGVRAPSASRYLTNIALPALTRDQILIVFNERVQFTNTQTATQLMYYFDVKVESQPNSTINPSLYTVEAYNDQTGVASQSAVDTRMVIVTLTNPINEAVSVSLRANSVWDGNRDASGLNVMNDAFETGFIGPMN